MVATYNSIEHVVEDGLCHRCGACLPICPVDRCITFDDNQYPQVNAETCIECGLCERVCSGDKLAMDVLKAKLPGSVFNDNPLGGFHAPYLVQTSADLGETPTTTLLARLLEAGEIDGVILAGVDPHEPWKAVPSIARSADEVRQVMEQGTAIRHTTVPLLQAIQQVLLQNLRQRQTKEERYAVVGVACHVHGLRMLMSRLPVLRRQIRFVIGPMCNSSLAPHATIDLLHANKLDLNRVDRLEFHEDGRQNVMQAWLKDGRNQPLHADNFRDRASPILTSLYAQPRCHLCYDYGNELADLTIDTPQKRSSNGQTLALPRTKAGAWLIEFMQRDEAFEVAPADASATACHQRSAKAKQSMVQLRIDARVRRSEAVPEYDRPMPSPRWVHRLAARPFTHLAKLSQGKRVRYWLLRAWLSRWALPMVWAQQMWKLRAWECVNANPIRKPGRTRRPPKRREAEKPTA